MTFQIFTCAHRRFPKARVWPPLPATAHTPTKGEDEWSSRLPALDVQEHLLELYFTCVHAQLPIVHKASFMELFRTGYVLLAPLTCFSAEYERLENKSR